ncbi:MAG: hypothetical protein BWY75_02494 [bacterium ADurb.Bin425]|nr:MAG: hypothetical protein BWY75_02494 [bacterium ADurb.Bin425]
MLRRANYFSSWGENLRSWKIFVFFVFLVERRGNAEIDKFDLGGAVLETIENNIARLEVSVQNFFFKQVLNSACHLQDDFNGSFRGQSLQDRKLLFQRSSFNIVHNQKGWTIGRRAELHRSNDIGMLKPHSHASLFLEAKQGFGLLRAILGQEHLDCPWFVDQEVSDFIDAAHAACTYEIFNFIVTAHYVAFLIAGHTGVSVGNYALKRSHAVDAGCPFLFFSSSPLKIGRHALVLRTGYCLIWTVWRISKHCWASTSSSFCR